MTTLKKQNNKVTPVLILIKKSFELYKSQLSLLLGYSAWLLIPVILNMLFMITFGSSYLYITEPIILILDIIITAWITISIIQIVRLVHLKKQTNTHKLSEQSWKLIIPFLLLKIIIAIGTCLGFILFVIPSLIFAVYIVFAPTILVLENQKITDSIKQSFELVRNKFWTIFHRVFIGNILILLPFLFITLSAIFLPRIINGVEIMDIINSPTTLIEQVFIKLVHICSVPLFIIFNIELYQNVKRIK